MNEVRVACFGNDGHQISGKIPARAKLVAMGGMGKNARDGPAADSPASPTTTAFEKMMAKNQVDLVSLCWYPRDEQFRWTLDCLKKGINVLADKPMAQTMDELESFAKWSSPPGSCCAPSRTCRTCPPSTA